MNEKLHNASDILLVLLLFGSFLPAPLGGIIRIVIMAFLIYQTGTHYTGKRKLVMVSILTLILILIPVYKASAQNLL